jgi:hypothetical protein
MALLLLIDRGPFQLLHRCCCPCCTDVIAIVELALLPLSCWCYHIIGHAGIAPVIAIVPLPLYRLLCLCCAGVVSIVVLATLQLLSWCCCPQCTGIVTIVALTLSTLLRWRLYHCWAGVGELKGTIFKLLDADTYIISRNALIFNVE